MNSTGIQQPQQREGRQIGSHWDLDELARARRLASWMFEQFAPNASGTVIEVGAGIGTFSQRLLDADVKELLLVEPDPDCAMTLTERFKADPRVTVAVETLPDSPQLAAAESKADFVLCQNVLEHIEDDARAVAAMARALRPGGHLTLLVPAHPRLYGSLDRTYGHHRRYRRERLAAVAEHAGLDIVDLYSFNLLGIAGWWAKNRRGASELGARSVTAYEALVRLWRPLEDRLRLPWGLSLILHARQPD